MKPEREALTGAFYAAVWMLILLGAVAWGVICGGREWGGMIP